MLGLENADSGIFARSVALGLTICHLIKYLLKNRMSRATSGKKRSDGSAASKWPGPGRRLDGKCRNLATAKFFCSGFIIYTPKPAENRFYANILIYINGVVIVNILTGIINVYK